MGSRGLVITPSTSPRTRQATQVTISAMFSLKALTLLVTAASLAQAHSLDKRETTVTFEGTYEDVRQLAINIVLAFTLATVMVVVVAPLFGYKFDLIVTALNDLDASEKALADPQVVDPTYGGYSGYSEAAPQPLQGYRMMPSGGALTALGARILRSLDIVDETCRMKTICQAESYAVNHPVAKLAINTLNSSFKGLEKYQHAVIAGQNGEDCSLLYSQCPVNYFGLEY